MRQLERIDQRALARECAIRFKETFCLQRIVIWGNIFGLSHGGKAVFGWFCSSNPEGQIGQITGRDRSQGPCSRMKPKGRYFHDGANEVNKTFITWLTLFKHERRKALLQISGNLLRNLETSGKFKKLRNFYYGAFRS